jgi:hypothetical protein
MKEEYEAIFIRFYKRQADQLRDLRNIRREPMSEIIRNLFDDFYNKPRKESK